MSMAAGVLALLLAQDVDALRGAVEAAEKRAVILRKAPRNRILTGSRRVNAAKAGRCAIRLFVVDLLTSKRAEREVPFRIQGDGFYPTYSRLQEPRTTVCTVGKSQIPTPKSQAIPPPPRGEGGKPLAFGGWYLDFPRQGLARE
jgi:hypothetical protein